MKTRCTSLLVALSLVLSVLLASPISARGDGQQAILRFVHAVSGAQPVDVYVDGNLTFSNVAFRTASDYASFQAGEHTVRVVITGGASAQPLLETQVTLDPGSYHTLAAAGQTDSVEPLDLTDSSTLPTINESSLRFVNAAQNAPTLDITPQGEQSLFQGVGYLQSTEYTVVTARTWDFVLQETGTQNVQGQLTGITLTGASVYTVFILAESNGQGLVPLVVLDAPPPVACEQFARVPVQEATQTPSAIPKVPPAVQATSTATAVQVTKTPTPVQVTKTPTAVQVTRTPSVVQVTKTPTAVQVTRTPTAVQVTKTPTAVQVTRTPSVVQVTKTPTAVRVTKTPTAVRVTKTPTAVRVTKTPTAVRVTKTPSALPTTPCATCVTTTPQTMTPSGTQTVMSTGTPGTEAPTQVGTGTPTAMTAAAETPAMPGAQPQNAAPPESPAATDSELPQGMSLGPGPSPVTALFDLGLSVAAVLGGLALRRRLF